MAELIMAMVAKHGLWSIIIDGAIVVLAIAILKLARQRAD